MQHHSLTSTTTSTLTTPTTPTTPTITFFQVTRNENIDLMQLVKKNGKKDKKSLKDYDYDEMLKRVAMNCNGMKQILTWSKISENHRCYDLISYETMMKKHDIKNVNGMYTEKTKNSRTKSQQKARKFVMESHLYFHLVKEIENAIKTIEDKEIQRAVHTQMIWLILTMRYRCDRAKTNPPQFNVNDGCLDYHYEDKKTIEDASSVMSYLSKTMKDDTLAYILWSRYWLKIHTNWKNGKFDIRKSNPSSISIYEYSTTFQNETIRSIFMAPLLIVPNDSQHHQGCITISDNYPPPNLLLLQPQQRRQQQQQQHSNSFGINGNNQDNVNNNCPCYRYDENQSQFNFEYCPCEPYVPNYGNHRGKDTMFVNGSDSYATNHSNPISNYHYYNNYNNYNCNFNNQK